MSEKIPARRIPAIIFALSGRAAIRFPSVSISLYPDRILISLIVFSLAGPIAEDGLIAP